LATGSASAPGVHLSILPRANLLAPENGGQIMIASSDDWAATIDGKESWAQVSYGVGNFAVYAFKDEHPATIDGFAMLITETADNNIKEFELSVGNDTPTGSFQTIGKFQTQNIKLFKTPYQEFKFAPVRARYVKLKILSTYGGTPHPVVHEFQLLGKLD
jgi:hypothetical protein